jgi:hypothetical protein
MNALYAHDVNINKCHKCRITINVARGLHVMYLWCSNLVIVVVTIDYVKKDVVMSVQSRDQQGGACILF